MNNDILSIYVEQFPNKELREFHFSRATISRTTKMRNRFVIFGAPKTRTTCGLVSNLRELNQAHNEGKLSRERLREECILIVGQWCNAKPDWNFALFEVSWGQLDHIYDLDLNRRHPEDQTNVPIR